MEQEVFDGIGIIKEKSEAMSKKGEYWKYMILLEGRDQPNTFNFFNYEEGTKAKVGMKVQVDWYENEGTFNGQPVIYKNVKSIFPIEDTISKMSDKELAEQAPLDSLKITAQTGGKGVSPSSYNAGARIGMIFNNAVNLCIAENKTKDKDIEEKFNSLIKLMEKLEK